VRILIDASDDYVNTVSFSADGSRLVAGTSDGWLRVYDARSGRPVVTFPAHRNWVVDARFSPDGRLIASASKDQSVRVWNAKDGAVVASLDTNGEANSIAFSSDGRRLLVAADDGVRIWDFTRNRTIVALRGFSGGIGEAEFALHDTRIVTIGSDNTLRLWAVPELPICQGAIDEARARMAHELAPQLRNAESITPRHAPSILNALLPSQTCS
jgi:WD40 repeat protein